MPDRSSFNAAINAVDRARVFLASTEGASVSYGDLCAVFTRFSAVFTAQGIGSGEHVAILLPQGPEAIIATLATMNTAVAAPLNPALAAPELLALLRRMRARVMIANASLDRPLLSAVSAQGIQVLFLTNLPELQLVTTVDPLPSSSQFSAAAPPAAGLLLPTSGTSGEPKLVKLSHRQMRHAATHIAAALELTGADRNLCVLPCFHIHGLSTVLATLLTGGRVISGGTFFADSFTQALVAQQVSWLSATPVHYRAILAAVRREGMAPPAHKLRLLRSASAPIADDLASELEQVFGVPLIQAYGMTEAGPQVASNGLSPASRRVGSVGRPAGAEVLIRPVEGFAAQRVAVGEIVIRGDSVVDGYVQDASAQDASAQDASAQDASAQDASAQDASAIHTPFSEGWFHTGDIGYLDEDGFLFVTGRIREMINSGGEKLSPQQIESVLQAHPAVRDAVAFAAPHATLGEIPHAAVVLHPGFLYEDSEAEAAAQLQHMLQRYCLSRLASFKVPHAFHFVPEMPTGPSGKVRRHALYDLLSAAGKGDRQLATRQWPLPSLHQAVATAWSGVLGPGDYAADDNFFQLGGDSLTATMAMHALERELQVSLPADCFFQHPTLAQQTALLTRLMGESLSARQAPSESALNELVEQVVALSAGQRRLWFLHRAGSGSEYNMGSFLWLRGQVDPALINQCLEALRRRHTALRTMIGVLDGNPVQRIRPYSVTELSMVDICCLPREQRAERALSMARAFRNQRFELDGGSLFRYQLIRLDSNEFLLAVVIHHIICDGWSMEILQRELISLYKQFAARLPINPFPAAVQFHDYVAKAAQRQQNTLHAKRQQIQWWRQQLADLDPILYLPGNGEPPDHLSTHAAHRHFSIPNALVQRLEEHAIGSGATLYMLLASALGILLHRYTRQERFCLGTVSANRQDADLEQVVGFLAKTLPLPIRVAPTATLDSVVADSVNTVLGVFAHADVGFDEIIQACASNRVEGVSPLFQVMFAFHNYPQRLTAETSVSPAADACGSAGLLTERVVVDADRAKFELSLHMRPVSEELVGVWQYRCDKIDAQTIAAMNRDFAVILRVMVDAPGSTVADIAFEDDSLADSHPAGDASTDADPLCVMHRFARHAGDNPERIAIRANGDRLTYGDAMDRVGRLANYLAGIRIGAGSTVAILLPRDSSMVIAPLAVMSTGAAFVPLDCLLPVARLREMVAAARVDLLIVNSATRAILSPDADISAHVLCLDQCGEAIARCPASACWSPPAHEDTAYIVFTSGSTGKPKGVAISHGNLAHYIRALARELEITASDSYLHAASCAFSASIRQYLLPLASGAEVVIAERHQVENVEALLTLVARERITILDLVPTSWRACLRWMDISGQLPGEYACPQLRLMLSASESLPAAVAKSVCTFWPHAQLINMYGQTETSGIVTTYPTYSPAERGSVVALGKPIAGHAVYLLDERGSPVPAGVVGEICVSGPSVGRGYLAAQSLLPHSFEQPLALKSGTVSIYRTGDLGRLREDGNLEFRGRLDAQIKYRGFRIAPGDIESVALEHTAVTDAVILVADGAAGQAGPQLRLLFSALADTGADSLRAQLRAHLRQRLPSYMVPSQLIQVEALPRTLSGKPDRATLSTQLRNDGLAEKGTSQPAPKATRQSVPQADPLAVTDANFAAPERDAPSIMRSLQSIWQQVLLCDTVGLHDNFFDLGGNSILSIEIVSAAADAGLHLTLDQVFQFQTIAELAAVVQCRTADACEVGSDSSATFPTVRDHMVDSPAKLPAVISNVAAPPARYTAQSLRAFCREALERAGMSPEGAAIVTEVQLESSLRGQATHNIADIPRYAGRLAAGVLNANPAIEVVETSAISATVDGDNAPGQWVATIAIDQAIALAQRSGAGIVSVKRSNHFGAAGHYAWRASQAGMIGMCFTNGPVVLAPTGGVTPLFGNNPLAIAVPRRDGHPIVLDIAMSVATRGRIGLAVAAGNPLQAGWVLDKLGLPTTRLEDLAAGLAAPIGGHKGYGLALAIEILAGALTGAGFCRDHAREASARHGGSDIGHFFVVFDPQLFIGRDELDSRVADIVLQAKSSELAAGSTEIFVPGEIEFRAREENLQLGVPLQATVVRRLADYGHRHKLVASLRRASQD
jgi:amino acid adenylation domain-containing protein